LEKDRYRVRQAFEAAPGKKFIVADYGQLELRLLAHVTNCKSMLDAFEKGGDFHSRTAIGMYEHVKKAVDDQEVLLEWDYSDGKEPDRPLLKDQFGTERKKAKTLNFSIAYGKTARGLSKDWGVSLSDAQATLDRWFADRPEVLEWQKKVIEQTRSTGATTTLMGRRRPLPDINSPIAHKRCETF
jgi:DNA polymerase-1